MSKSPNDHKPRALGKSFVGFMVLVMAAGLVGSVPASALGYNNRPDVELEESVAGSDASLPVIERDDAVAEAAMASLSEAAWPEAETVHLAEMEAFSDSGTEASGPVSIDTVTGEEFEEWVSPLPTPEEGGEAADTAPGVTENERKLPREPEVEEREEETPSASPQEEGEAQAPEPSVPEPESDEQETEAEAEADEAEDEVEAPEPAPEAAPVPVSAAELHVLNRSEAEELGLDGLALRLVRTDDAGETGPVRVEIDYSAFASAYGADYGPRLGLIALTEHEGGDGQKSLTTHPLESANNTGDQSLTALAPASGEGVLLAAVAQSQSEEGTGDFGATSLSPSSTWNVGPQTGNFSWTYPLATPASRAV